MSAAENDWNQRARCAGVTMRPNDATVCESCPVTAQCYQTMDDNGLGAEPNPPETVTHLFAAMFPGQCPVCDLPIDVGDQIAHTDRDRYIHDTCTGGKP